MTYELCSLSVVLSNSVFANVFYYVMEGCVVALIVSAKCVWCI